MKGGLRSTFKNYNIFKCLGGEVNVGALLVCSRLGVALVFELLVVER